MQSLAARVQGLWVHYFAVMESELNKGKLLAFDPLGPEFKYSGMIARQL
jgi:hypothetical protein